MDRMRAGLTGLGLVFLATLAASVLFVPDVPTAPKEPNEPLAQLGVAPGADKQAPAAVTSVAPAGPPMADPSEAFPARPDVSAGPAAAPEAVDPLLLRLPPDAGQITI